MDVEKPGGMHAFIVSSAWMKWISVRDNSFKNYLAEVGTPSLVGFAGTLANNFNGVAGFYIKVPDGWSVKFAPMLRDVDELSEIVLKVSEISM